MNIDRQMLFHRIRDFQNFATLCARKGRKLYHVR